MEQKIDHELEAEILSYLALAEGLGFRLRLMGLGVKGLKVYG